MKLQFKEQNFQLKAVDAVVKCFEGQTLKSNHFTLERSKEIIRKTKQLHQVDPSALGSESLEDIGYINSTVQITDVVLEFGNDLG